MPQDGINRIFFPILVRRDSYPQKANGSFYSYSHYRDLIAEDCQHRCVYCDAFADDVGGSDAMQLDHFRPESFPEFEPLINDPDNLHYSCGRCNLLKSNHWPARGTSNTHTGTKGFVDPFADDRHEYFAIDIDGAIRPKKPPAAYMIRLLRLDREYLRKLREVRQLRSLWKEKVATLRVRIAGGDMPKEAELLQTLDAVQQLLE